MTADAKFQVWDLSVSDIDPIISIDTNDDIPKEESATTAETDNAANTAGTARTKTNMLNGVRRDNHKAEAREDSDKDTPVPKLLKHLCTGLPKRSLTSIIFAENSPVAMIGDNRGIITVYRINEPNIMKDISLPVEQAKALTEAVYRNADPADIAKLSSVTSVDSGSGGESNENKHAG